VLREAFTIFRREFIEIGNIEVFLDSFTTASACNKVLRKKFLTPYTIGLIHASGYSCNQNYRKKALTSKKTNAKYHMPETGANTDYRITVLQCGRILSRDKERVRVFGLLFSRSYLSSLQGSQYTER